MDWLFVMPPGTAPEVVATRNGLAVFAQAKVEVPFFSATASAEVSPCPATGLGVGTPKDKFQLCSGPFCATSSGAMSIKANSKTIAKILKPGVSAQAKVGERGCFTLNW